MFFRSHISPICLPTSQMDLIGKSGFIAGWGKTEVNMGHTGTNILRTASVPIIEARECIKWHESKQINVELFGEMFCAGHSDGHQDACLGKRLNLYYSVLRYKNRRFYLNLKKNYRRLRWPVNCVSQRSFYISWNNQCWIWVWC